MDTPPLGCFTITTQIERKKGDLGFMKDGPTKHHVEIRNLPKSMLVAARSGRSPLSPITVLPNNRVQATEFQMALRFCSGDKKGDFVLAIADVKEVLDKFLKEGKSSIVLHQIGYYGW